MRYRCDASRRLATQPGRHEAPERPAASRRNWSITGASTDRPEAKTTIATWFNPRALGGARRPARNRTPAGAAGAALEPLKPPLVHHEQLQELHRRRMGRRRRHTTQHQPVGHDRHHRPLCAGRRGADRGRHRRRACRLPGLEPEHAAAALRRARCGGQRDPRPQGRDRPLAVARRRQDPAGGHWRNRARGDDLQVLRRRSLACRRRGRAVGSAGVWGSRYSARRWAWSA